MTIHTLELRNLSDHQLLSATENIVKTEREILLSVLQHLREIDRRKLYSALKYKSLFEYVVKKLGYSEDQAFRRISAMRMLKSFPAEMAQQIESKLQEGTLCLTHLNMAQSLFKKEEAHQKISIENKMDLFAKLENTSTREAERIVIEQSSQSANFPTEKIRPINDNLSELKVVLSLEQLGKIQKLKGLLAHKNPKMAFPELLEILLDLAIAKLDPGQKPAAPRVKATPDGSDLNLKFPLLKSGAIQSKQNSRYISAELRREIWRKCQSRCVNCKSTFALEIDHIQPLAHGGKSEVTNLRLTCRSCNQRAAWKKIGPEKMQKYLDL